MKGRYLYQICRVEIHIIYYGLLKGTPEREILTNIDKYSSLG